MHSHVNVAGFSQRHGSCNVYVCNQSSDKHLCSGEHPSQSNTKTARIFAASLSIRTPPSMHHHYYVTVQVQTTIPLAAVSVPFSDNSCRLRSSFSSSILCIVPWYSDSVRSTESRMSLTVALNISFREDSRRNFRFVGPAIVLRKSAVTNCYPVTVQTV